MAPDVAVEETAIEGGLFREVPRLGHPSVAGPVASSQPQPPLRTAVRLFQPRCRRKDRRGNRGLKASCCSCSSGWQCPYSRGVNGRGLCTSSTGTRPLRNPEGGVQSPARLRTESRRQRLLELSGRGGRPLRGREAGTRPSQRGLPRLGRPSEWGAQPRGARWASIRTPCGPGLAFSSATAAEPAKACPGKSSSAGPSLLRPIAGTSRLMI